MDSGDGFGRLVYRVYGTIIPAVVLAAVKRSFLADPGAAGEWVLYGLMHFAAAGLVVLLLAGEVIPRLLPSWQVYPPQAIEDLQEVLDTRVYPVLDTPWLWLKKEDPEE